MSEALAWVGQIADWIGKFIPRWVVIDTTMAGVKFVRGSKVVVCLPGIHWFWPATTILVIHPTARQTANLKSQTITLRDEKVVIVGGLCVYEIKDVEAIVARTYDPDDAIKDISLSAIHDVCCQLSWAEITEQQRTGELDKKLKIEARKELERYGVKVLKMTLTDLAPARVLKIVQATTAD